MDASLENQRIRFKESDHYSGRQQQRPQLEIDRMINRKYDKLIWIIFLYVWYGVRIRLQENDHYSCQQQLQQQPQIEIEWSLKSMTNQCTLFVFMCNHHSRLSELKQGWVRLSKDDHKWERLSKLEWGWVKLINPIWTCFFHVSHGPGGAHFSPTPPGVLVLRYLRDWCWTLLLLVIL